MRAPSQPVRPKWGPLTPQRWPQDDNQVPSAGGQWMPPIERANKERSRQESFTMTGRFDLPNTVTVGQQFQLYLPTDADGDFWCDQIYMMGWGLQLTPSGVVSQAGPPIPGTIDIADARTGRSLCWPQNSTPTLFFSTLVLFSDDTGFEAGNNPFPDGWRSTSILPAPFCFTRAAGISINLISAVAWTGVAGPNITDIAFSGWKEYEFAST